MNQPKQTQQPQKPDYQSQKKYLSKQSSFRVYYQKQHYQAIREEMDSLGFSAKDVFEMGLKQMAERIKTLKRFSNLIGVDPEKTAAIVRSGKKKAKK